MRNNSAKHQDRDRLQITAGKVTVKPNCEFASAIGGGAITFESITGGHMAIWQPENQASGTYFVRCLVQSRHSKMFSKIIKALLVK